MIYVGDDLSDVILCGERVESGRMLRHATVGICSTVVAHVSSVGSVLYRTCTIFHNGGLLLDLNDLDRDLSDV